MMKAIVQNTYGSTDVLALEEIPRPRIADDEVLVRVRAAGVDRGVWHLMTGLPYPIRLAGYGLRAPKTRTPGMDLAGVVEAVGDRVTEFQPGDEVFGIGQGAFADFATAPQSTLAAKPATLTFEQAAAIGTSGLTALQGLRDSAGVRPGQKVLILGASGGVGSFAVQVAKALGAEVTGVCSARKLEMVRTLGADHVIDYSSEEIAANGETYDVILDAGGNRTLAQLRRALTPTGIVVLVGGETGGRWLGGFDRSLRAPVVSRLVGQQLKPLMCSPNKADLIALADLISAGQVTPAIDRAFPLAEAATAIQYMEDGNVRGKVVITV